VIGFSDAREGAAWFYSQLIPAEANAHAVDRCLLLVAALGASPDFTGATPELLPAGQPVSPHPPPGFLLIHPISRGLGKSLSPDWVLALAERLAPQPILIVGRSPDWKLQTNPRAGVFDLINRTSLLELIWLLRLAGFVLSVVSGPMHLASALGRPLLGVHTWSDPRRVGPYHPHAWIWKAGQIIRRHQVDDALSVQSRAPGDADIDPIADLVTRELDRPSP
jgi:ADP-heptose:LPS heptosyltransferase